MYHIQSSRIVDEKGRTVQWRGVNLGGSSKVPFSPDGATWKPDSLKEDKNLSFIGRPFPLQEADEHFSRLKAWGLTFLRFLVTWEAIEHEGPGIYDQEYLDYLYAVVKKAGEHGLELFIDPHEDVWSRFTGGDGAPRWTLDLIGLETTRLHATGAAFLQQELPDQYPTMIWGTNNDKLAAATLFTLFFAGNDFAPKTRIEDVPVQDYLQSHYINAIKQAAERLKDLPNVIGYDSLNEPSSGYIGVRDIHARAGFPLLKGEAPTIFQSMLLGSGFSQEVDIYDLGLTRFVKKGAREMNSARQSAWKEGFEDLWKQHGVWGLDVRGKPQVLIPDYFYKVAGRVVDFNRDYFKPFANRFAQEIRSICPEAIIFIESVPNQNELEWDGQDAPSIVHAAHWYDDITLVTKRFMDWFTVDTHTGNVVLGKQAVRRCFAGQIAGIIRQSNHQMNGVPTLIGEVGIPFDLGKRKAYRTGDFSNQIRAMDATMAALESNFASFTLWNYTADNTNAHGDQWNDEDLSIFSRDQQKGTGDLNDGGRALKAILRPYARRIPGEPLSQSFELATRTYRFAFRNDPAILGCLEVYLPAFQYPQGVTVNGTQGKFNIDPENQRLEYFPDSSEMIHEITIRPKYKDA
jgi:hypothetical protein